MVTLLCSLNCSIWQSVHSNSLEHITVSCDTINPLLILAIYGPLSLISGFLSDFSGFDHRFATVMSLFSWHHVISTLRWLSGMICFQTGSNLQATALYSFFPTFYKLSSIFSPSMYFLPFLPSLPSSLLHYSLQLDFLACGLISLHCIICLMQNDPTENVELLECQAQDPHLQLCLSFRSAFYLCFTERVNSCTCVAKDNYWPGC